MGRVAALLCLIAAAFFAWWILREEDPAPRAPSRSPAEAPVVFAPRPAAPREAPPEAAPTDVRVRGRVRRPDGVAWQGMLHAVGEVDGERRRLDLRVTHEGGEFVAEIPFEGASSPWPIDFGIQGGGFARASQRIEVEPGGEYRADFDLGAGGVLEGVVVDSEERVVPGLQILVRPGDGPESFLSQWSVDVGRLLRDGSEPFALCRTDAAGRFSAGGLPPGTYALVSLDERWALHHEEGLAPDRRDVRAVAQPAYALVGTAVDRATGAPLATVRVEMILRTSGGERMMAGTCAGDRLLIAWNPVRWDHAACTARVTVSAKGYDDHRTELSFGPDARRHVLRAALAPSAPPVRGTLLVEPVATTGRLVDFPLTFALMRLGDADGRPALVKAEPLDGGLHRLEGTVGRWKLLVQPHNGLLDDPTPEIEIREGVERRVRVELPPHAVLRLCLRGFEDGVHVSVHAEDETRALSTSGGRDGMVFVVAPGGWSVEVSGAADPAPQRVELTDGQEVTLTFVR